MGEDAGGIVTRIGRKRCGFKKKTISCKNFTKQHNDNFLSDEIHCFSAKFMMNICCGIWQVLSRHCGKQQHNSTYKPMVVLCSALAVLGIFPH